MTKKIDFDNAGNGGNPNGSLVQASNGKLYGMTYLGGTNNYGVLFRVQPHGWNIYQKNRFRQYGGNGRYPRGSLVQAGNGKLYGMTYQWRGK